MRRFDDPAQAVHVTTDEAFIVALAGNPTTGYSWHADIDTDYVDILTREFEAGAGAIGAAGLELFCFRAQKAGSTEITFEYRRPWAGELRQMRVFRLLIV